MYHNIKIAILGGDMRQVALGRRLADRNFEVAVWGLGMGVDIGECVRVDSYADAVCGARVIILPLPVSRDGVTLNTPLCKGEPVRLSEIVEAADEEAVILGGKVSLDLSSIAAKKGLSTIDYFECEQLQIKNAIPTAEGAIAIALDELPITLFGAKTAVIGYGRVGKAVTKLLKAMGADVTVAARKSDALAYAECDGAKTLKIEREDNGQSSLQKLCGCSVIFNTVPVNIIKESVLRSYNKDTLIIDLAGEDGGVDRVAAEKNNVRVIWALSLPGKVAPFTAADIIFECVIDILTECGVICG